MISSIVVAGIVEDHLVQQVKQAADDLGLKGMHREMILMHDEIHIQVRLAICRLSGFNGLSADHPFERLSSV